MAKTRSLSGRSSASARNTMASTNASAPAPATFFAYACGVDVHQAGQLPGRRGGRVALRPPTCRCRSAPPSAARRSGPRPAPRSSPRSAATRRWDSRLVPSSWGCTMFGCQLVFHRPPSWLSRASLAYAQVCGTPGKVQVTFSAAVAESSCRFTAPTVTAGRSGPMPDDQRLEQRVDLGTGRADELHRGQVLLGQPGGQLGRRPFRRVLGAGIRGRRVRRTADDQQDDGRQGQRSGGDAPGHPATRDSRPT